MKRTKLYIFVGLFIFLLGVTGCSSSQTEGSEETEVGDSGLPENMTWSVYDVGSGGYAQMSAIADMLTSNYGTNVRMLPSDSGVSRMIPLRDGKASVGKVGDEVQFAFEGIESFADQEWGPQNVRAYWAPLSWYAFAVREDSGIEKISDLKGKRIAKITGNQSVNVKTEAILAFGGLSWDDVEVVNMSSYTGQGDALVQGKIDVAAVNPTASAIVEADSKEGVRWLEMDDSDEEGWDRVHKVAPWLTPEPTDRAAGTENDVMLPAYGYMVAGYADQDPGVIYSLLKAMDENFDEYKDAAADLKLYGKDEVQTEPVSIPFSEGTVKFLKENDMWDDEKEKGNEKLIERQEKLRDAWDKVVEEAEDKDIGEEDFPEYWLERKEELVEK